MNSKRLSELTEVVKELCCVMRKTKVRKSGELMTVIMSFAATSVQLHPDQEKYWSDLSFAVEKCSCLNYDDDEPCIRMIPFMDEEEAKKFEEETGSMHGTWNNIPKGVNDESV